MAWRVDYRNAFFDRPAVIAATTKAERDVLTKIGAYTRSTARRSIQHRKYAVSKPGAPPYSHKGTLKRGIQFAYDAKSRSLVVGPTLSARASGAPEMLEYGGYTRSRNARRKDRKWGDGAIIRIGGKSCRTSKQVRDSHNKLVWVTFAKLVRGTSKRRNASGRDQLARADEMETMIWGPKFIRGTIAKRPYMQPAFDRELALMPPNWRNSIK